MVKKKATDMCLYMCLCNCVSRIWVQILNHTMGYKFTSKKGVGCLGAAERSSTDFKGSIVAVL